MNNILHKIDNPELNKCVVFADHHNGRDKTGAICVFFSPVRLCLILKLFLPRVHYYRGVKETRRKQFLNWTGQEGGSEEKKRELHQQMPKMQLI